MHDYGSPYGTPFFNDLYSLEDTSPFPQQPSYPQPLTIQNSEKPLALVNSLAIKTLSQNPKKRKCEEEPEINKKPTKRAKIESLNERIRRFEILSEDQKEELLRKSTNLVLKYYKASNQDQVLKFISEISDKAHKILLLAWIRCVRNQSSLIKRTFGMFLQDQSKFNQETRNLITITMDLPEKSKQLSRYIYDFFKTTPKDYTHWLRSTLDENIHEVHISSHQETRKKIQEDFQKADVNKQLKILNNNLDCIIQISYSCIVDNTRYPFEEIKKTVLEINLRDRLALLHWMLYYTNIDTVRLINYLTKYNLPLDRQLVNHIKKLTNKIEPNNLSTFRQTLKRREDKAKADYENSYLTNENTVQNQQGIQPITYTALPVSMHPSCELLYAPHVAASPYPYNFQMYNPNAYPQSFPFQ
jgi:predicted outer membrane protein